MLDFKNGFQFIGLLAILITCVLCINFKCHQEEKVEKQIITKRDTITVYKYGAGQATKVIRQILRVRDTITILDTSIRFRNPDLDLIVTAPCSDTPLVEYRIKEKIITDSILIKDPVAKYFGIGIIGSSNSFTPAISYSSPRCNYLIGYDVKNKVPSFGILVNFANIAKPARLGE